MCIGNAIFFQFLALMVVATFSLLSLDHDDVVTELGLDRRIRVDWVAQAGDWQGKGGLLKRADHGASSHPAQRAATPRLVLAVLAGNLQGEKKQRQW